MDTDDLTHRHSRKSEGIVIAKIKLVGKWQLDDIVDTFDVTWLQSHLLEFLPIEGCVVIDILRHLDQTTTLDLTKLFAIHALYAFIPNHVVFYLVC